LEKQKFVQNQKFNTPPKPQIHQKKTPNTYAELHAFFWSQYFYLHF